MPFFLFSNPLKIVSLKQQSNTIAIGFNQNINQMQFKKFNIKSGVYYNIEAEFTLRRKTFKLNEGSITISQFSKEISRIVVETKNLKNLNFSINKKILYLSFSKTPQKHPSTAKIKTSPKSKESKVEIESKSSEEEFSDILNLFNSIDSANLSKNVPNDTLKDKKESNLPKPSKLKNKIIVLDPGHGGKDCGAQVNKICEKDVILKISKKLEKLLKDKGYQVYLTRTKDIYINLVDRTKFANDKNADIFVSIHANALDKKSKNYKTASGIETYFLSTARSERARKVAELENKDDVEVMNYFSKLSFLNSINSQRLLASNKLALDIQQGMLMTTRVEYNETIDGGVREGPFWVLAGALMPSVLVEVGYMTNDGDLKKIQMSSYQSILAEGIVRGIDSYFLKNF